jgi:hypothetical protein
VADLTGRRPGRAATGEGDQPVQWCRAGVDGDFRAEGHARTAVFRLDHALQHGQGMLAGFRTRVPWPAARPGQVLTVAEGFDQQQVHDCGARVRAAQQRNAHLLGRVMAAARVARSSSTG